MFKNYYSSLSKTFDEIDTSTISPDTKIDFEIHYHFRLSFVSLDDTWPVGVALPSHEDWVDSWAPPKESTFFRRGTRVLPETLNSRIF